MSRGTILIAAGGTGGHMFPAAAFAQTMKDRGFDTVLMTDARGRRYADNFPADQVMDVPAATFQGKNVLKLAGAALKIMQGIVAAKARIAELKPVLIAGFGGYPSLPALVAAGRVPVLIHEQNAVLGKVNRSFAARAKAVACGFDRLDLLPAASLPHKHVTGNPVRADFRALARGSYPDLAADGTIQLLITGGSQGARILGELVPQALAALPPALKARLRVTQQVRDEQIATVEALYKSAGIAAEIAPFFKDLASRVGACHLFIGRSGASTVTELCAVGRPAILLPLKIAADDHQTANAEGLKNAGAADVITEDDTTVESLLALLTTRLSDTADLTKRAAAAKLLGKPDAADRLANLAEKLIAEYPVS